MARLAPLLLVASLAAAATSAAAAADFANTATGTINVSLTVLPDTPPVTVSGLSDLTLIDIDPGHSEINRPFCLSMPAESATYSLTVTTKNEAGGRAYLAGPNDARVQYVISYSDVAMVKNLTFIDPVGAGQIDGLQPSHKTDCAGEPSSLVIGVTFAPNPAPGDYTDLITLTITPG